MTLGEFDAVCRHLPGAWLVIQWGDAHVWKVGRKIFAVAWPSADPFACLLKASDVARQAYSGVKGITPAPYLARAGWLKVEAGALDQAELCDLLRISHLLVVAKMPKKQQAQFFGD